MHKESMKKDFGDLLAVNATLEGISLAAYAILISFSRFTQGGISSPEDWLLTIARIFFTWAVPVFLIGPWMMIVHRACELGLSGWDLVLGSVYTSVFWGILIFLTGYMCLVIG